VLFTVYYVGSSLSVLASDHRFMFLTNYLNWFDCEKGNVFTCTCKGNDQCIVPSTSPECASSVVTSFKGVA